MRKLLEKQSKKKQEDKVYAIAFYMQCHHDVPSVACSGGEDSPSIPALCKLPAWCLTFSSSWCGFSNALTADRRVSGTIHSAC